jgi:hypothetical protein
MSTPPQPQPPVDVQPLHLQDWRFYVVLAIQLLLAVASAHGLNVATQPAQPCNCPPAQSSPGTPVPGK